MNQQVYDFYDFLEERQVFVGIVDKEELLLDFELIAIAKENNVGGIKGIVCEYYGIAEEQINSKTRKREVVQARQIVMYFLNLCTRMSLEQIGMMFKVGHHVFDHATVLSAVRTVRGLNQVDKAFKIEFAEIREKVFLIHKPICTK